MVGVADGGGEDLCFDAVVVVDGADGADEFHAIFADVVEAADEGADEERASLGDHECLQGLEAEGHVGFGAFVGEGFARLEAFDGARKLDDDIGGDFRAFAAFNEHRFGFDGDDFSGDWAFDDLADVGEAFAVVHAFFGDEGWVSGYAIEDTKVRGGFDVIEVGTVEVDEHGRRIGGWVLRRRAISAFALESKADESLLILLSGGGSAHPTQSVDEISLESISALTRAIQNTGATIVQLNAVRKHVKQLKGGQLAAAAMHARYVHSLILSDVVGDRFDAIASGPTASHTTTSTDALNVLEELGLKELPLEVTAYLERCVAQGTCRTKPLGDPCCARVANRTIAS